MPERENPYENMSWPEYLWSIRDTIIGIELVILVFLGGVYAVNQWSSEPVTSYYVFAPLFQFYAAVRIAGIKHGVTSEDLR